MPRRKHLIFSDPAGALNGFLLLAMTEGGRAPSDSDLRDVLMNMWPLETRTNLHVINNIDQARWDNFMNQRDTNDAMPRWTGSVIAFGRTSDWTTLVSARYPDVFVAPLVQP